MTPRSLTTVAALIALLNGCQNFSDPPTESNFTLGYPNGVIGDLPHQTPGTEVQLAVKVTNRKGKPVEGVEISWDDGYVFSAVHPARSLTDTAGLARTFWTMKPLPPGNFVASRAIRAYLPGASHNPIEYRVEVVTCTRGCGGTGNP